MKKVFLAISLLLIAYVSFGQAVMTFEETTHDFGTIEYAGDGSYIFKYTNTGNQPLIIMDVEKSCGCTTPTYSQAPLKPGETAQILVEYDTSREGTFSKTVTIKSTASNSPIVLKITGEVELMKAKSEEKTLNNLHKN